MQDLSTLKIQNIADPWDNAGEKWNLIDGATVKTTAPWRPMW